MDLFSFCIWTLFSVHQFYSIQNKYVLSNFTCIKLSILRCWWMNVKLSILMVLMNECEAFYFEVLMVLMNECEAFYFDGVDEWMWSFLFWCVDEWMWFVQTLLLLLLLFYFLFICKRLEWAWLMLDMACSQSVWQEIEHQFLSKMKISLMNYVCLYWESKSWAQVHLS